MSEETISRKYAQALLDLAEKEGSLYPIHVSVQEVSVLLKSKQDFRVFVHNPLLNESERARIIGLIFDHRVPPLLLKFLTFLNAKNRLDLLEDILVSFTKLYQEKNNQLQATLESAFPLEDIHIDAIKQRLKTRYHKDISIDTRINADLIGGFRLWVAETLIDSSIKSQLEHFRRRLLF